ncbi:MAG: YkgJ family cysteine cluster protein [Candidatus Heimdallarchaeota archaeon]|nr:YkgJ family cysteine cluster protein [Candidatus Heimdallarchaeota archaeon]
MDYSGKPIAEVNEAGEITILKHIHFICKGCADCCRLNNIPVTEKDVQRLLDNGIEVDQSLESLSPVLIPSTNVKGGFIKAYIFKRKPFVKECAFLDENLLCKIHSFKPLACQLYPFAVRKTDEGFIAIIHPDTVCKFIDVDVKEEESNTSEIVQNLISLLSLE